VTEPVIREPEEGATGPLKALQDTAIAAIRTAFPAWWIGIVVWAATKIRIVEECKDWLYGPAQALVLAGLIYGLRYLFGFIEKRKWIPDWVAVILLGSAKRPLYVAPPVADAVNDGRAVPVLATKHRGNTPAD
jgi:hypothetical protein